jgi:hypothetical protein
MGDTRSERKLAAVVVADVVGYSRLTAEDEEGTIARLRRLRSEIVEPAIASHRGRLVKTLGDGFLIEFASAVDAVRSSLEMQDGLRQRLAKARAYPRPVLAYPSSIHSTKPCMLLHCSSEVAQQEWLSYNRKAPPVAITPRQDDYLQFFAHVCRRLRHGKTVHVRHVDVSD